MLHGAPTTPQRCDTPHTYDVNNAEHETLLRPHGQEASLLVVLNGAALRDGVQVVVHLLVLW